MKSIKFWVPGVPAQQGSKKHVGNGIMVESSKALPAWRVDVSNAAAIERAKIDAPLDGYLTLTCTFFFPMPASRKKAIRFAGLWPKNTAPDGDKLIRAIGDSLTVGNLIRDDARIFRYVADKWETVGLTGVQIEVASLEPGQW